jgi:signal peptidase I
MMNILSLLFYGTLAKHIFCYLRVSTLNNYDRKRIQTSLHSDIFDKTIESPLRIFDVRKILQLNVVFVPVIGRNQNFTSIRNRMFNSGCYPGVDYILVDVVMKNNSCADNITYVRIEQVNSTMELCEICDNYNCSVSEVGLVVRPSYPLISQLEREWPITVNLSDIPYVITRGMYNTLTIGGSVLLATAFFLVAFLLSQFFTFSVINSRSMMPTILPKDVILVDKASSYLKFQILNMPPNAGDIIFFKEPIILKQYLSDNHLPAIKEGDLLVKRVLILKDSACIEVRGDNPPSSLDSRQFGCFPVKDIVGNPLIRMWPPQRFGIVSRP